MTRQRRDRVPLVPKSPLLGLTLALSCEHNITKGGEAAYHNVLVGFNAR